MSNLNVQRTVPYATEFTCSSVTGGTWKTQEQARSEVLQPRAAPQSPPPIPSYQVPPSRVPLWVRLVLIALAAIAIGSIIASALMQ